MLTSRLTTGLANSARCFPVELMIDDENDNVEIYKRTKFSLFGRNRSIRKKRFKEKLKSRHEIFLSTSNYQFDHREEKNNVELFRKHVPMAIALILNEI